MDKSVAVYDAVSDAGFLSVLPRLIKQKHLRPVWTLALKRSCLRCLYFAYRTWGPCSTLWNNTTGKWPDLPPPPCNLCSHHPNSRAGVPGFQIKTCDFCLISFFLFSPPQSAGVQWCNSIFSSAAFCTVIDVAPQVWTSRALWSAWKDSRFTAI